MLEDVSCLYGEKQSDLLSPCIYSIVDREFYARFHFKEGTKLLKEFLEDKDDQSALIMLILGKDEEEYNKFYLQRKQAEAHMVTRFILRPVKILMPRHTWNPRKYQYSRLGKH